MISSRQELQESQSTVNQLTTQIQKLQERANSSNDSRDFQELETASNSGLSHVPSDSFYCSEFMWSALPQVQPAA